MAGGKSPSRGQPRRKKSQTQKMSSAPHQPKTGRVRQHVLYSYDQERPRGKQVAWKSRRNSDLPADLFPEAQGNAIGKVLVWFLVPIVVFVVFYLTTNVVAQHVQSGTIKAGSAVHTTLCTSLDIALAAGLNFDKQTEMASCSSSSSAADEPLEKKE